MKLHYHPVSPYSRKALVAVLHRGDPVELNLIDIRQGGLRTPAFLALNPFGKMPVLETPDGPVFESTSIIEYLEERGPKSLLPAGSERLARHFDRLGDMYLLDPQTELFFRPDTPAAQKAPETVAKAWNLLETALGDGRAFLCGATFSLGDLGAAIGTDYLVRLGLQPPQRVAAWHERCFAVPAMAQGHQEAEPMLQAMLARRVVAS